MANSNTADDADVHLHRVFNSFDRDGSGAIDRQELQAALEELGLPSSSSKFVEDILRQYDTDSDSRISFEEFKTYVQSKEARIRRAFTQVDRDGSGRLDPWEVQQAAAALGLDVSEAEAARMVELLDEDGDAHINYEEFRFVVLLPAAQVSQRSIMSAWVDSSDWLYYSEYRLNHVPPLQTLERFLAGGVAGAASRSLVAPLERLRTIMMADRSPGSAHLAPVLRRMWADGRLAGLFRGNAATLVKVFPNNAVQYGVYEVARGALQQYNQGSTLSNQQNMAAGLVAGATACTVTYPLELLRTQIQVGRGAGGGYLPMLRAQLVERGAAGLFQGFTACLARDSLSGALGFATYEFLCSKYQTLLSGGEQPSPGTRGALGGLAAFSTAAAIMPLENVMRRLQVQGRPGFPRQYSGTLDCLRQMLAQEGLASFWRGSLSSFAKVVPSIAATRLLYEALVEEWGIGGVRRYRQQSASGG